MADDKSINAPEIGVNYGYLHKIMIKDNDNNTYSIYVRMDTTTEFGSVSVAQSTTEERQAWFLNMTTHMIRPICYYEGFHEGEYWGEITPLSNLLFYTSGGEYILGTTCTKSNGATEVGDTEVKLTAVSATDYLVQ